MRKEKLRHVISCSKKQVSRIGFTIITSAFCLGLGALFIQPAWANLFPDTAPTDPSVPYMSTPQNNPAQFGTPTQVDLSKLDIEGGVLRGISADERLRLWSEAEKHNTPVILDLSSRNDITEVAQSAINGTPIMILKLPASIQSIGNAAFARNLIRELDFSTDPSSIASIGTDAFKQLEGSGQGGSSSMAEITEIGAGVYKPVVSDVMFIGGQFSMSNPYSIKVAGQPVKYGQITRQIVLHPNFVLPAGAQGSDRWSKVQVTADYVEYNKGSTYVNSQAPYAYLAVYGKVNLSGAQTLPLNRVFNIDITPEDPYAPGLPQPKLEILGINAGYARNVLDEPLKSQGWKVVSLKEVYPDASEEYIAALDRKLRSHFSFSNFYGTPNKAPFLHSVSLLNYKSYDYQFMAKPKKLKYVYYDVSSGEVLGEEDKTAFYGAKIPQPTYPEGYESFIKPSFFTKREIVNDAIPFVYRIPVQKVNTTPSKFTVTYELIDESGVRFGTKFYAIGNAGEEIVEPQDLQDFLNAHGLQLKDPFPTGETFTQDKSVTLTLKGSLADVVGSQGSAGPAGPQGEKGDKGDTGEQGPVGPAGPKGNAGPAGPAGPKGDAGPAGPAGAAGVPGKDGRDGVDGRDGAPGVKGDTGSVGAAGVAGKDGRDGADGRDGIVDPEALSKSIRDEIKKQYGDITPRIGGDGNWYIGDTNTGISAQAGYIWWPIIVLALALLALATYVVYLRRNLIKRIEENRELIEALQRSIA